MNLPVSCDHPIAQPISYPRNNPPFVPSVTVLPEGQNLLVFASSEVANEAARWYSNSNSRLFCFNLLASNNWQNANFAEVVKLAIDLTVLRYRQGQVQSALDGLAQAVQEILVLYTSLQIVSYPELQRRSTPQQQESAKNNVNIFRDIQAAINGMYAQMGVAAYPAPQMAAPVPPMGRNMGGVAGMAGMVPVSTHPAAAGLSQTQAPMMPQSNRPQRFPSSQVTPVSGTPQPATQSATAASPNKGKDFAANFVVGEVEKMDREQHTIIYFGKKYEIPTSPIRRQMEEAVETHENLLTADDIESSPFVNLTAPVATPSLEELMVDLRARYMAQYQDTVKVYSSMGTLIIPVISTTDLKPVFKKLTQSRTFQDICNTLLEAIELCGKDKVAKRATLTYISQIDRELTRLLNEFLVYQCGLTDRVTSFVEDSINIGKYLNDTYGPVYNKSLSQFEMLLTGTLFNISTQYSDNNGDSSYFEKNDIPEGVFNDQFGINYHLTYLSATHRELGYNVSDTRAKRLTSQSAPMLHRLITALLAQQAKSVVRPLRMVVFTADDHRFQVFPMIKEPGVFNLIEV